ncbi:MAG: MbcA/ParS/Xre antitoxin family protein [Gemmatimonadota bacterium]|jgi:hypothetical protein
MTGTALPSPEISAEEQAEAGFRAFVRIAAAWGLTVDEQLVLLGAPARSTYYKWKRDGASTMSRDTLERVSYVLGIWKALAILFPDPARADAWLTRPNTAPTFGGRPALERMLSGQVSDLFVVRQYLGAQLGGWP